MTSHIVSIASPDLTAEINAFGAELWRLQDAQGRDFLWHGDPAWWTGRAPLLFPVIGRLPDDRFTHGGQVFELPKHGFARRRQFEVVHREAALARLRLRADAATRQAYPFDFVLEMQFEIVGPELRMRARIANGGSEPMPAAFGFHPAFRWPLPGAGDRARHAIDFAEAEKGPLRRVGGAGLLDPARRPTPVVGRRLPLRDDWFIDDALVFERLASRSLRYAGEGGPGLMISWTGLPHLGVWTKPGAPFICIEPWADLPAETGAPPALSDRMGLFRLAAGATVELSMIVRLD
jgi:galactose mutarotase-like enzyme